MKYCILRNECTAEETECADCPFYKSLKAFKDGWLCRKEVQHEHYHKYKRTAL